MGCKDLTSVPDQIRGEQAMKESTFSLAILDIHLGAGTSFELAKNLLSGGVPLILASGYDSSFELPPELNGCSASNQAGERRKVAQAIEQLEAK